MMRILALFAAAMVVIGPLLVCLPPGSVAAQDVSEMTVKTPMYWPVNGSPYRVHGNITIDYDGILTIEPGVTVLMDEGTHINVTGGQLYINGNQDGPVRFEPNSSTPYRGFYDWIYVNNTPTNNATLVASHAYFSYCTKGFYLDAVDNVTIRDCRFNDTAYGGIYVTNCRGFGIWNCSFTDSDEYGLVLDNCDSITVGNCHFINCAARGVDIAASTHVSLQDSIINNCFEGAFLTQASAVLVTGCNFSSNALGLGMENSNDNSLMDNTYWNDTSSIGIVSSTGNILRNNTMISCKEGIILGGAPSTANNAIDADNTFAKKPVRFFNSSGTFADFEAGEVIVAGCAGATIGGNVTFPTGGHVQLFACTAATVTELSFGGSLRGIFALDSIGVNVTNVTVTNPEKDGLECYNTTAVNLKGCQFTGGKYDVYLNGSSARAHDISGMDRSAVEGSSTFTKMYSLKIKVNNENGTGIAGVDVLVNSSNAPDYATPHFSGSGLLSNENGFFEPVPVTGSVNSDGAVSVKNTTVTVWKGNLTFSENPRTLQVTAPNTNITMASLPSQLNGELTGYVQDAAGKPLSGAAVNASGNLTTLTNLTGAYRFVAIPAGSYKFSVSLAGYQPSSAPVQVVAGVINHLNFTLTYINSTNGNGTIKGTVRNFAGSPIAGASVTTGIRTTTTDAAGNFTFLEVAPGFYNLTASALGYNNQTNSGTVAGGLTTILNFTLGSTGTGNSTGVLSGLILSLTSAPVVGATVTIDAIGQSAVTNANGTYRISGIAPGRYSVTVRAGTHGTRTATGINITAGAESGLDFWMLGISLFVNETLGVSVEGELKGGSGELSIQKSEKPPKTVPPGGGLGIIIEIEPLNGTKVVWLNITIKFVPGADMNTSELHLYWFNKTSKSWLGLTSGYDASRGVVWARVDHLSIFGIGRGKGPGGEMNGGKTILAIPPFITPVAIVAVVLLVGVPIGVLVIRRPLHPENRQLPQRMPPR